jgi:Arc/MetJ-type ribon-helix-helix transcriptional regulator
MESTPELLAARIAPCDYARVMKLVGTKYVSRSDLLRHAVRDLLDRYDPQPTLSTE